MRAPWAFVALAGGQAAPAARQLAANPVKVASAAWEFPLETTLKFNSSAPGIEETLVASDAELTLYAGIEYDAMTITADTDSIFEFADHSRPSLKLVPYGTSRQDCESTPQIPLAYRTNGNATLGMAALPLYVYGVSGQPQPAGSGNNTFFVPEFTGHALYSGSADAVGKNAATMKFMHGGVYGLCYAPDGTFAQRDNGMAYNGILNISLRVVGIASSCVEDGCMTTESWNCYFEYGTESPGCQVAFSGARLGWTTYSWRETVKVMAASDFPADVFDADGFWVRSSNVRCPSQPTYGTGAYFAEESRVEVSEETNYMGSLLSPQDTVEDSFTVAACACPGYDKNSALAATIHTESCNSFDEFTQDIGKFFYWSLRLCDLADEDCTARYLRVLPHQNFLVRMNCPPGGACSYDSSFREANRLKFLRSRPDGKASWDANDYCKVYSPDPDAKWTTNTPSGGDRQDYKVWGIPAPSAADSTAAHLQKTPFLTATLGSTFDVCYCDKDCGNPANFFKVGKVKVMEAFGFASQSNASASALPALDTVNKGGTVVLYAGQTTAAGEGVSPYDGPKFTREAIVNIRSFDRVVQESGNTLEEEYDLDKKQPEDFQALMDSKVCSKEYTESTDNFLPGVNNRRRAADTDWSRADYVAKIWGGNVGSNYLAFTGATGQKQTKILQAGALAVCYCAQLTELKECADQQWWYAGKITIRGPRGDAHYAFPTNVVVRLDVEGWGLSSNDILRIIPEMSVDTDGVQRKSNCLVDGLHSAGSRTQAKYELVAAPGGGPPAAQGYKLGCPAQNGAGCSEATNSTNILAYISEVTGCEAGSSGCKTLSSFTGHATYSIIEVATDATLSAQDLETGDMVELLLSQMLVDSHTQNEWTAEEEHTASRAAGVFRYQDTSGGDRKFIHNGHRVVRMYKEDGSLELQKFMIPVGFEKDPKITFAGAGYWRRTSRLESKEEIVGSVEQENLKVCWGTTNDANEVEFYSQAGTVSFKHPPEMPKGPDGVSVHVSLSTTEEQQAAPVVIAFTTGASYRGIEGSVVIRIFFRDVVYFNPKVSGDKSPYYAMNGMQLTIPNIPETGTQANVDFEQARQSVCGYLFSELWTNDDEGFPMPKGCYYSRKYKNKGERTTYREYSIVFEPKNGPKDVCYENGVKTKCEYMVVVNAAVLTPDGAATDETKAHVLDVLTMCKGMGCADPYMVLEKGAGMLTNVAERMAQNNEPNWGGPGGAFVLENQNEIDNAVDLSDSTTLAAKLRGGQGSTAIVGGSVLRILLYPLTMWSLAPGACNAECIGQELPQPFECGTGAALDCQTQSVQTTASSPTQLSYLGTQTPRMTPAGGTKHNAIRIVLPDADNMEPISDTVQHTVRATSLSTPLGGFFPQRVGAEISKPMHLRSPATAAFPMYTTSEGYLYKTPALGQTETRLIMNGESDYGPRPFTRKVVDIQKGEIPDTPNIAYLRIRFGATVWHNGRNLGGTIFVKVPKGYQCDVPEPNKDGRGGRVPSFDRIFLEDQNDDGYPDNSHGVLSNDYDDGHWENNCEYRLAKDQLIPAGTVIYVKVAIDMKEVPYTRDDQSNEWALNLAGMGQHLYSENAWQTGEMQFIDAERERQLGKPWIGNLPTLSQLEMPLILPGNFATRVRNEATIIYHDLSVYFQTPSREGYQIFSPHIRIHAPELFDFGAKCEVDDLPDFVYAYQSLDNFRTHRLRNKGVCVGSNWDLSSSELNEFYDELPTLEPKDYKNRARFLVDAKLSASRVYAFKIRVKNPRTYRQDMHAKWSIWTEDFNGFGVDGTKEPVPWIRPWRSSVAGGTTTTTTTTTDVLGNGPVIEKAHYQHGWGLYDYKIDGLTVTVENILPYSVEKGGVRSPTTITVYPIRVPNDLETNMRFIAPYGYVFEDMTVMASYTGETKYTTWKIYNRPMTDETQENVLVWDTTSLLAKYIYGFQAMVRIPDETPTNSSNAFYLELGYSGNDVSIRVAGAAVDAPQVRAILNMRCFILSNRAGYTNNFVEFQFELITPLISGDGLVIQGDENTRGFLFRIDCMSVLSIVDDGLPFEDGTTCRYADEMGIPKLELVSGIGGIFKGKYMFEWPVKNPAQPQGRRGTFTIESYKNIAAYPNSDKYDKGAKAYGVDLLPRMMDGQLVEMTPKQRAMFGRDDRPFAPNVVIMMFQLESEPEVTQDMTITAPRGFEFNEDCFPDLVVDQDELFGSSLDWPDDDFVKWPTLANPRSCVGEENIAVISVPVGLGRSSKYVLRINLRRNGPKTPLHNYWTIRFNGEVTDPFDGFPLWTFSGVGLTAVSTASTLEGKDMVGDPVFISFTPTKDVPSALDDFGYFRQLDDQMDPEYLARWKATWPDGEHRRVRARALSEEPARGGTFRLQAAPGFSFTESLEEPGECSLMINEGGNAMPFGPMDSNCTRLSSTPGGPYDIISVEMTGAKPLKGGLEYRLMVAVLNPVEAVAVPQNWKLQSFDELGLPLDDVVIPGFKTNPRLNNWVVDNQNGVTKGLQKVRDLLFTAEFPTPLKDGDTIKVESPQDFVLRADGVGNYCNEFMYPVAANGLKRSPEPSCTCSLGKLGVTTCHIEFSVDEGKNPAFPQNTPFTFALTTTNPKETPPATENFWRIYHYQNGDETSIIGSDSTQSWDIQPQMQSLAIALAGPTKVLDQDNVMRMTAFPIASQAMSAIIISFIPVLSADTLVVEAVYPTGFDFEVARVDSPMRVIESLTEGPVLAVDNLNAMPEVLMEVLVTQVQLGRGGGETVFNLATYVRDAATDRKILMDQRNDFRNGFRLPGLLEIKEKELFSIYQMNEDLYPVRALFPAQVDYKAMASFSIVMSQPVFAKQRMIIESEGDGRYMLLTEGFVLKGIDIIENSLENNNPYKLTSTLGVSLPSSRVVLAAATVYDLAVYCIPRQGVPGHTQRPTLWSGTDVGKPNVWTGASNTWRIQTRDDHGVDPTNTNDGRLEPFLTVAPLPFVLSSLRTPPMSDIIVYLQMQVPTEAPQGELDSALGGADASRPTPVKVESVLIIAPAGFDFEQACGQYCFKGQDLASTGRRTANLQRTDGLSLTSFLISNIAEIKVKTPPRTPEDAVWFLEAKDNEDRTLGWGEDPGFAITQMQRTSVRYASVAGIEATWFAVVFQLSSPGGVFLKLEPPTGYRLGCVLQTHVHQANLPGAPPTCVDETPLTLSINKTLGTGMYAFLVKGTVPLNTPQPNTFNLVVMNEDKVVLDAAYGLPGKDVQTISACCPSIAWTKAVPGVHSTVTIGFEVKATFVTIRALVIKFPQGFRQDMPSASHISNLNKDFPVAAANNWAEIEPDRTRIRIFLDDTEEVTPVPPGEYKWRFPVIVPKIEDFPSVNIWYLLLCTQATCNDVDSATAVLNFPLPGFGLNEKHPSAHDEVTSGLVTAALWLLAAWW